jgi:hypothetical protein
MRYVRGLKDLEVEQIKAMLWQGDPPVNISRHFLVTQGTVSAIKHGRLHPHIAWPNGSIGALPDFRATELYRQGKIGMLRASEMASGRGHIRSPGMRFPVIEREQTDEEIWMDAHRFYEEYKSGEITEDDLKRMWLVEKQEREEAQARKEQEEWERREKRDLEQLAYEATLPEETQEDIEEREQERKERFDRLHMWRNGLPQFEHWTWVTEAELDYMLDPINGLSRELANKEAIIAWREKRLAALAVKEPDDADQ